MTGPIRGDRGGLSQGLHRLQNFDRAGRSGELGTLADVDEAEPKRLDRFDKGFANVFDLAGGGEPSLERRDDVGTGLGQDASVLDVGDVELCFPPAHDGEVGEAEVLKFPVKPDLGVAARAESVGSDGASPCRNRVRFREGFALPESRKAIRVVTSRLRGCPGQSQHEQAPGADAALDIKRASGRRRDPPGHSQPKADPGLTVASSGVPAEEGLENVG
jgi:hypothetical protein